jgi:hypothetical protein
MQKSKHKETEMALTNRLRLGMLKVVPQVPTSLFSLLCLSSPIHSLFHTCPLTINRSSSTKFSASSNHIHRESIVLLDMSALSKLAGPSGSDAAGTAPAIEFPAYGYLHHEISILIVAEDEHDAVLVDSLEHEPSPILRAFKALSTTSSYHEISRFHSKFIQKKMHFLLFECT